MAVLSLNDRSKVIGYYATTGNGVYGVGSTSCLVAGTKESLEESIGQCRNRPPGSTYTVQKMRVAMLVDGTEAGEEYALNLLAYQRFLPILKKVGYQLGLIADEYCGCARIRHYEYKYTRYEFEQAMLLSEIPSPLQQLTLHIADTIGNDPLSLDNLKTLYPEIKPSRLQQVVEALVRAGFAEKYDDQTKGVSPPVRITGTWLNTEQDRAELFAAVDDVEA